MINKILMLIRENEGITLQETARRLNISADEVMAYECGKALPSNNIIKRYSDSFGVPVSSIQFFSEEENNGILTKESRLFFADKLLQLVEKLLQNKK